MIAIPGAVISNDVVAAFEHEADMLSFDGPLLAYFRGPANTYYLCYWVDCDRDANRWMLLKISAEEKQELLQHDADVTSLTATMGKLFQTKWNDQVYLTDRDEDGFVIRTTMIALCGVPATYLPKTVRADKGE